MKERLGTILGIITIGAVIIALVIGSFFLSYAPINGVGQFRREYSAYVRGKSTNVIETNRGSKVVRLLTLETLNAESFQVEVSEAIYQQAKPAMFIEKSAHDHEPTLAP
jgi:hypothetical protein